MTLIIELIAEEYEVPVGGEAIVYLEDGQPHSIDLHDDFVVVWDESGTYKVDVVGPDKLTH